jgi:hypothetical protein
MYKTPMTYLGLVNMFNRAEMHWGMIPPNANIILNIQGPDGRIFQARLRQAVIEKTNIGSDIALLGYEFDRDVEIGIPNKDNSDAI